MSDVNENSILVDLERQFSALEAAVKAAHESVQRAQATTAAAEVEAHGLEARRDRVRAAVAALKTGR